MCCCDKPTINGEMGYKWQPNDKPSIRPVNPPSLDDRDILLYDEPGRCGGLDSHCHHYRLVQSGPYFSLLVRNGGGDKRIDLSLYGEQRKVFDRLNSNDRYWLLNAIYHAHSNSERKSRETTNQMWINAAAEKRIKTRKVRGRDRVKVWIERN